MKRILTLMFAAATVFAYGCSDNFDDSALWKDIDGMYKSLNELKAQVTTMQQQLDALAAVVSGGAVTSITQDADGHYVLSYKDADNVEHTIDIATMDDANTQPIIGMKADGEIYYWTVTTGGKTSWLLDTDGAKIPVTGRTPEIGVDDQGYWTLFGKRITDASGNPVKAEGKSASVITKVEMKDDGTVVFTLGDGVQVTAQVQNGFNVLLSVEPRTVVTDVAQPLVITYTLVGETETSVLTVEKAEGLAAKLDEQAKTITVTFPDGFEEGRLVVMFYDGADNVIIKPLIFTTMEGTPTGIRNADDLKAFASAVNAGKSLAKYTIDGEVCLMNDIDMAGTDWSDYVIGGVVTPSTADANKAVTYAMGENVFDKVFNGKNFALKNVDWTFDLADGNVAHGLFSALGAEGEIKNLTIEGVIRLTGAAPQGAAIGAFAGYAEGKITSCTNKAAIAFAGSDAANISVCLGGIAGYLQNATLTQCVNDGALTCGTIANTGNGSNSGFHQGGIVGYMKTSSLTECTNNGALSAPSGRSGGIVAVATSGQVTACVNNGKVQDDVNGIFGANPGYKRMGGLAGGASADAAFTSCVNNGDVFSQLGCRTGGFVGHNEAKITKCENKGVILSDHTLSGTNYHGSGWAAGYNKSADLITECVVGGRVGDYTVYKDNPQSAPEATYAMAIVHGKFDPTLNGLSDQYEEFYDWEVKAETQLAEGVKFYHYAMKNFAQNVYVVEADLTNPNVVLETVMADELCLNPNANNNSNNGKKLRETLSETCTRRRAEGRNIVAGINTGFFNSHDGFPRGFHIEYGEPVFINNPTVRQSLSNHRPGFTFFEDRTVSFDNRSFTGYLKVNDTDYEYYSVNDTIVRLNNTDGYDANLYTSRFRKEPHPGIYNPVGSDALFVVGRCSQQMTVNDGWFDATVTAIVDGRNGASVEVPFVSEKTDWVLQVTGEKAAALAAALKVGDAVRINANVSIGSVSKQIIMHNSSMYRFLNGGNWNAVNDATLMPATCIGADQAGTTVKLVCVDGRTSIDTGMNYWQLYMTMKKLGLHNAIRFDGGGSTTLWKWENGAGAIANRPCDSKGERSSHELHACQDQVARNP
ncbi:MAG: PL29 family lyase N-terminal domain-containing protein [Alistipes finegoldii]